ncbi:MAG: hypothetical protein R3F54_30930 [Alphaproteobacteria bacterium]
MKAPTILLGAAALLTLGACAGFASPVPDTTFAQGKRAEAAISSYYEDHASEDYGRCNRPYFDAITKVDVVEDTASRLVLDVRYKYWDRLRDDEDSSVRAPGVDGSRKVCWGFESRQFTLEKTNGDLKVVDMTGPVRGKGAKIGNVTIGGSVGVGVGGTISK